MRFQQLKRKSNAVLRQKMYKSGKSWVIKSTIAFLGGIALMGMTTLVAKAEDVPPVQPSGSVETPNVDDSAAGKTTYDKVDQEVPANQSITPSQNVIKKTDTPENNNLSNSSNGVQQVNDNGDTDTNDKAPIVTNYIRYLKPDGTPFLNDDGSEVVQTVKWPEGSKYMVAGLRRTAKKVIPGYQSDNVDGAPIKELDGESFITVGTDGTSFNVTVPKLESESDEKVDIYEEDEDGTPLSSMKQINVPVDEMVTSPYRSKDFVPDRVLDTDNSTVQIVNNDGSFQDYTESIYELTNDNGSWHYAPATNLNDFINSYLKYMRGWEQADDYDGIRTVKIIARYKDTDVSKDEVKYRIEFDDAADGHVVFTTPENKIYTGTAGTVPNLHYDEDHTIENGFISMQNLGYSAPGYNEQILEMTNRLTDDTKNIQTYHIKVKKMKPFTMEFNATDEQGNLLKKKVLTEEVNGPGISQVDTYDGNGILLSSKKVSPEETASIVDDDYHYIDENITKFINKYIYDDWVNDRAFNLNSPKSYERDFELGRYVYGDYLKTDYTSLDDVFKEYIGSLIPYMKNGINSNEKQSIYMAYDSPKTPTNTGSSSTGTHHTSSENNTNTDTNIDTESTVKKNQTVATTTNPVILYSKDGKQITDRVLGIDTGWFSDEEYTLDGVMYYRVATDEFAKSDDVYVYIAQDPTFVRVYNNENGDLINYKGSTSSRMLQPSSQWKTDRIAIINGQQYYRVATDEFVPVGEVYEYANTNQTLTINSLTPLYDERGKKLDTELTGSYKTNMIAIIKGEQYYRIATNEFVKVVDIK